MGIALGIWGCDFTSKGHKDILEAQRLISERRYDDAADKYLKVLEGSPSDEVRNKVTYQLGVLYSLYLNDKAKAIQHFKYLVWQSEDINLQINSLDRMSDIFLHTLSNQMKLLVTTAFLTAFRPKLEKHEFYEFRHAVSLLEGNEFDKAEEEFNRVAEEPKHEFYAEAFYQLGIMRFKQKRWQEAVDYWKKYTKVERRQDKLVQAKFMIANTLETLEQLGESYKLYYSILGDYPNPEVIRARLKSLYARRIARKR